MVISSAIHDSSEHLRSTFASRYVRTSLPRFQMQENSIPKEAAYQIINDELMLDGNPRLNLASFVTTWMEPECDKLIMNSINKNYVDMDEYPVTTELQNRCVNIIANLFNAPVGETETAIGVGTVGSSEAIMLAGLAFKRKWQQKRKLAGKPYDNPNIVTGANVQVCWEKFARYFEVELKEVKLTEGYYVMDPNKAVEMVDENTICAAAILGSTLTGEFEDVKLLNDLLTKKNEETGWDVPIHVDAASGGFIAPFLHPDLVWDFRLPLVKSINLQRNSVILCLFPKRKMVISSTVLDSSEHLHSTFASRYVRAALPKFEMPRNSIPKDAAYQIINDELMLDGNPRLNLASFVTTWMEPECDKLIMNSINKNYVDMDEYPVTTELQNRCVNIIANLFNAPVEANETAVGVGTVGSSEAIMLAGLAFKRNWQKKRRAEGKPTDNPNIVTGANVQVCWEKFARYFEVELKEVHLTEGYYVMNPEKAVEMVDENTICVAAILGSTLTGEFEDVKLLNDLLTKKNEETGWDIPIHVDAASGGFIAPFLHPELEWDFRLPLVKSINVSGHKYGLVYAGVGWVVWRTKDDLPDELVIRLGFEGYKNIMANCAMNAKLLREGLEKMKTFEILSKDIGVPLVAFSVKDSSKYTVFNISHALRKFGWIVPAYTMPADAQHIAVLRVVIREDFSCSLAERLLSDIDKVLKELEDDFSKKVATVAAVKKSDREIEELVVSHWKKFLEGKSKNVVC